MTPNHPESVSREYAETLAQALVRAGRERDEAVLLLRETVTAHEGFRGHGRNEWQSWTRDKCQVDGAKWPCWESRIRDWLAGRKT